jgi:hypothetical protein
VNNSVCIDVPELDLGDIRRCLDKISRNWVQNDGTWQPPLADATMEPSCVTQRVETTSS